MSDPENDLRSEILALIDLQQSLQLATVNPEGIPEASYTPFIYRAPDFYILVSGLASHTANLLQGKPCGGMLIEDESRARNLFARTRLMLTLDAIPVDSSRPDYNELLDTMQARLGNTISMLRQLPDFKLIQLKVIGGRFVKGFGAAYEIKDPEFKTLAQIAGR